MLAYLPTDRQVSEENAGRDNARAPLPEYRFRQILHDDGLA